MLRRWFPGFKLPLVVNNTGDLLNMTLTPGNTDDRKPARDLLHDLFGKVFGDKGYIGKALADLLKGDGDGVELITKNRKNMMPKVLPLVDSLLLRKRAISDH